MSSLFNIIYQHAKRRLTAPTIHLKNFLQSNSILKFYILTFQFQLVEIAFNSDINKGISLLERRNARWGDRNTLELSCIGNLRSFIASKYYLLNTHLCTVSTFGSKSDNLLDLQEIVTTYHPSHKGSSKYICTT